MRSSRQRREPGALKAAVMRILWDAPDALTAAQIRTALGEHGTVPALTTVLTVLERLRLSGEVTRVKQGVQESLFSASEPESAVTANAMLEALLSTADRAGALVQFSGSLSADDAELLRRALKID